MTRFPDMRRGASIAAVLAMAACTPVTGDPSMATTASSPAVVQPPEVRLVGAIETAGCVMTADNVASIQLASNLTQAELADIVQRLDAAGRVEVAGSGAIRVLTERCI